MKIFVYCSFVILLISQGNRGYSQDISRYLDDGFKAGGRNIISIGYDPLSGEVPMAFEHRVMSNFSCVIGGGPISISRQNWLIPDEPLPIKQSGIGLSAFIKAKIYFHKFPERAYFTLYPRINLMDHKVFSDLFILNIGYQRIIVKKILLGVETGIGVRFYHDSSWAFWQGDSDLTWQPHIPVSINIGYLF